MAMIGLLVAGLVVGCNPGDQGKHPHLAWTAIDSLNALMPDAIEVYQGSDPTWPLKAWYARVSLSRDGISARVLHSDESEGRETTSSFAYDQGACVVLNGGYFRMDLSPSKPIGLLMVDSALVQHPTRSVLRSDVSYPVARAAIGFYWNGNADIAWVSHGDSGLVAWSTPPPNSEQDPVQDLDSSLTEQWPVREAIAAGPALISEGRIRITVAEEVFFGSRIPDVHPRSAVGVTREGDLILLVVDGRQSASRGADLNDLAQILLELGSVEAMNLDGGGSSAMVVDGVRLNRPSGRDSERKVASVLAVFCE